MMIGGFILMITGLNEVGGWDKLFEDYPCSSPNVTVGPEVNASVSLNGLNLTRTCEFRHLYLQAVFSFKLVFGTISIILFSFQNFP